MLRDLTPGAPAVELGIPVTCLAGRWLEGSEEFSGAGMAARFLVGQGYKQVCGSATAWGDGRESIPIERCSRFNVHCTACSFEVTGWFGVQVRVLLVFLMNISFHSSCFCNITTSRFRV